MNDQYPVFVVALASDEWPGSSWRLYKVAPFIWHVYHQLNEDPLTYPGSGKKACVVLSKALGGLAIESIREMFWASDVQEMIKLFPYCD